MKWPFKRNKNKPAASNAGDPHIIPRDGHSISRKHISDAALKVMSVLHQHNYQGYLVGGGVRDLLLNGHPKDFDVATDATPEQVKALFRSGRIIGRRFKIVHVRFGREIIEVTTFRGSHEAQTQSRNSRPGNLKSAKSESGMLLRDNVYGTLEEDAIRRDFTINALYYSSADFSVYDYTNGLKDLENKTLRIIGDAETRYREDPVRMLRAIRFAAKLDFELETATAAPLRELAPMLGNVPAARMFDEILKLFMAGHGVVTFELMQEYGLFKPLFPQTAASIEAGHPRAQALLVEALRNTDARINAGKPVTPAFLYAALLWPAVEQQLQQLKASGMPEVPAMQQAAQQVASAQQQHTSVPRRFGFPMREIWDLQLRLPRRSFRRAENMMENKRFRAAYDFLLLREQAGEETGDLGKWWTDYQSSSPEHREAMAKKVAGQNTSGSGRKRQRNRNKPKT